LWAGFAVWLHTGLATAVTVLTRLPCLSFDFLAFFDSKEGI